MSNYSHALPPSYTEFTERSAHPVFDDRAAMYTAHQQRQYDEMRYPVTNPYSMNNPTNPVADDRAAMYTAPQQEQYGEVKYPVTNPYSVNSPTTPVAYGAYITPTPRVTFGRIAQQCTCANCRSIIVTRVEHTSGLLTWLLCIILFILCAGCCLCFIPFCISDFKNVEHYCPNCHALVGEHCPL